MLRKIFHSVLAMLILLSSTGLTLNMHFCHNRLIDLAVIAPAKSCCGYESNQELDHHQINLVPRSCHCEDRSIAYETEENYLAEANSVNFKNTLQFKLNWQNISQHIVASATQNKASFYPDLRRPPTRDVSLPQIQAFLL